MRIIDYQIGRDFEGHPVHRPLHSILELTLQLRVANCANSCFENVERQEAALCMLPQTGYVLAWRAESSGVGGGGSCENYS